MIGTMEFGNPVTVQRALRYKSDEQKIVDESVDEAGQSAIAAASQKFSPRLQFPIGIVVSASSFQAMKSDVNEIGCRLETPGHLLRAERYVGNTVSPKDPENSIFHPRRIAKLDGVASTAVQSVQEPGKTREILFKRARKLPKDRPEMFS